MAMPETTWSTLKRTVASAWMRPTSAPPTNAKPMPAHDPHFQAPKPPSHAPTIIIPSMPMFTIPARSAHKPARPASRIGVATRSVDEMVPELVRSSVSVRIRTIDSRKTKPSDRKTARRAGLTDDRNETRLMMPPPPSPRRVVGCDGHPIA